MGKGSDILAGLGLAAGTFGYLALASGLLNGVKAD